LAKILNTSQKNGAMLQPMIFIDRVEEVLEKIKANPKLYPLYRPSKSVYKCVVHHRIILYYKVVDEEIIDLLTFWNTYQDMDKLKL
jgi:hypothetical protein